jgi:Leucine-rich repeat (LRR) protein
MTSLREIDLSSNHLSLFPVQVSGCRHLQELRLIHNNISTIPLAFLQSDQIQSSLKVLILNNNPITELSPSISKLEKLEVLGIASTLINKLPNQIVDLRSLKQIYVHDTPLQSPKLALALRGIQAIREYFQDTCKVHRDSSKQANQVETLNA